MKVIDTHAHLYSRKFDRDQEAVIARAQEVLSAVFLPNIDVESIGPMHALTAKAPQFFFPMMGLHPSDVKENYEQVLQTIESYLRNPEYTYFGIGETGIDLYWDKTTLPLQQASLKVHIDWAKELGLPIILHAREAIDEVADMIEAHLDDRLTGIFHCFDGNQQQVDRILGFKSFMFGIGGIVTYRKDVQQVVKDMPLESIVLETDSPYLPPVPHRKDKPRRNESSYTRYVAQQIADLKGLSYEAVAAQTNQNAQTVFSQAPLLSTHL